MNKAEERSIEMGYRLNAAKRLEEEKKRLEVAMLLGNISPYSAEELMAVFTYEEMVDGLAKEVIDYAAVQLLRGLIKRVGVLEKQVNDLTKSLSDGWRLRD